MRWGELQLLPWLVLGLVVVILFLRARWRFRQKALREFVSGNLLARLTPRIDFQRQVVRSILLVLALTCLGVALLRPQFGTRTERLKRMGQDVVLVLDLSRSMLAEDFVPNRLEKAKQEIKSFLDMLEGDRIALVVFAGEAQVLCPLTLDYGAAELFLDEVDTDWLPLPGTNLVAALRAGADCFVSSEQEHKSLILITDGEHHEGEIQPVIDEIQTAGVVVYAIGVGRPEGVPVPVTDESGNRGYLRDNQGEIVTTKLDMETLQQLATQTGGRWHHATGGQLELQEIYAEIREAEDSELSSGMTTLYRERFQIPLLAAIVLLFWRGLLCDRRKKSASLRPGETKETENA